MATITRYILVDENGTEVYNEHATFDSALAATNTLGNHAIVERTYEFADSELVWTPNGSDVWPPKRNHYQRLEEYGCVVWLDDGNLLAAEIDDFDREGDANAVDVTAPESQGFLDAVNAALGTTFQLGDFAGR